MAAASKITIKNVSPLGALDVALLRRIVAAGDTVDVTADQASILLRQATWEPVSKAATAIQKHIDDDATEALADTETDVESEDKE